jgi:hypothetical protein
MTRPHVQRSIADQVRDAIARNDAARRKRLRASKDDPPPHGRPPRAVTGKHPDHPTDRPPSALTRSLIQQTREHGRRSIRGSGPDRRA